MAFDVCEHQIRQVVIKAAIERRKDKGLPEERNITTLFNEMAPLLGVMVVPMDSSQVNHLPAPHEMVDEETGKPVIPKKDCPQCGEKEVMNLHPICSGCVDAESGKYKTMWFCGEMDQSRNLIPGTGCGFKDKSDKHFVTWLDELGIDFKNMSKREMGVKTVTNEGLK